MTSSNPLLTHLQQTSSRISSMLTLGRKLNQAGSSAGFSPVAADFGGRKFQLAAQKMRVLAVEKLGNILPERLPQFGSEIQTKFAHVDNLLHISRIPEGRAATWSNVDMIFPQAISSAQPQVPEEPGTLRQGSIIPKFNTFPKPGQSAESFKEQIKRNPAVRKTERQVAKPTRLASTDRMFSHIQEITPESGSLPAPSQTESTSPPAKSASAAISSPTVQRKLDTDIGKVNLPIQPKVERKRPEAEAKTDQSLTVQKDETALSSAPIQAEATETKNVANPQGQKPVIEQPAQQSMPLAPLSRAALPVAQPVKNVKEKKVEAGKLAVAAPRPFVRKAMETRSTAAVVQRQQDASILPSQNDSPRRQQIEKPGIKPPQRDEEPQDAERAINQLPLSSGKQLNIEDQSLEKHFEYRQQAPRQIISLQPADRVVSPHSNPLERKLTEPIAFSQKYHNPASETTPGISLPVNAGTNPARKQKSDADQEQTNLPITSAPQSTTHKDNLPTQTNPIKMELAKTPRLPENSKPNQLAQQPGLSFLNKLSQPASANPRQNQSKKQASANTAESPGMVLSGTAAGLLTKPSIPMKKTPSAQAAGAQNTIQRLWEEHSPLEPSQTGGGAQASESGQPAGPDLAQMAEEILPMVKRLLEIEAERSGRLIY